MYVCISNMVSTLNGERDGEGEREDKRREEKRREDQYSNECRTLT